MNHRQALREARIRQALGIGLAVVSLTSTLLSLLKLLAQQQPALPWARHLAEPGGLLQGLWVLAPTPDPQHWLSGPNLAFLALYWAFFVGLAFFASGRQLGEKAATRHGPVGATAEGPAVEPSISRPSILSQVHQLYVAPILTSLIAGLLLKWIFEF
ncbi:MAG: YniB family protein [Pseudomonas sp.]|uniref:YniB family protein n=1 Tax=Pseudomonas sp. TaxID=306 RepID=UPI003397F432